MRYCYRTNPANAILSVILVVVLTLVLLPAITLPTYAAGDGRIQMNGADVVTSANFDTPVDNLTSAGWAWSGTSDYTLTINDTYTGGRISFFGSTPVTLNVAGDASISTNNQGYATLYSQQSLTITGSGNLMLKNTHSFGQAINTGNNLIIDMSGNGTVAATGDVFTYGATTITSGTVTFDGHFNLMNNNDALTVSGATTHVTVTGNVTGDLDVSDGTVEIIGTVSGTTNVTGGTVEVNGQTIAPAPTINSANNTTFTVGQAGNFQVTATNTPDSFAQGGNALPTGVTFSTTSGVLSGTPSAGTNGIYNLTFTATNAGGTSATQNFTLTVNPAQTQPQKHSILVNQAMTNGTVTVQGGLTEAAQGDIIYLTVAPASGYILTQGSLKYNTTPIAGSSFTMPGQAVTIYADFEAAPSTAPSVSSDAVSMPVNGTATFEVYLGDATSATVTSGSTATAVATPTSITTSPPTVTVTGKAVGNTTISIGWSGGTMDNQSTPVSVEVYANTPVSRNLTVSAGNGGSVSGSSSGSYAVNAPVSVTATANTNYTFTGWSVSGVSISATANPASFNMPDNDVTLTANFQYTGGGQQPQNHTVTFNLNGGIRTGGGDLVQTVPNGSSATAPTVTRSGYTFIGWDKSFANVTQSVTINALWTSNRSTDNDSDSGGSSGRDSTNYTAAPARSSLTVDESKAKAALADMQKSSRSKARITGNGEIKVTPDAWKTFGTTAVDFDTVANGAVQVRVTVKEPGKMTKEMLLSGSVTGSTVEARKTFFEKWYKNKVRVIHLDQAGDWSQPVEIAAKVDLTGMDTTNLHFYSYDKASNSYKRIEKPTYWIDGNGYLHFTTEYAGDIIISEGMLEKK